MEAPDFAVGWSLKTVIDRANAYRAVNGEFPSKIRLTTEAIERIARHSENWDLHEIAFGSKRWSSRPFTIDELEALLYRSLGSKLTIVDISTLSLNIKFP